MNLKWRLSEVRHHKWLRSCLSLWITLACLPGGAAPPAVSVVGYWRMGENDIGAAAGAAATNAVDRAGANNLAFSGPAVYSRGTAPAAFTSAGSTLCVNLTNSAFARGALVSTDQDNFGIEAWIKPTAFSGNNQIIVCNGSTINSGWGIFVSNSIYYGLFGGVTFVGAAAAASNVWTHVALVRTNGVATLFVNGIASGATTTDSPRLPAGNFAVGTDPQSPGAECFDGLVDEVRVFTCSNGFSTNDLLPNNAQPTYALGTGSLLEGNAAGVDSVVLGVNSTAASWTAGTNASWLHLSAANQSGMGSTNVVFSYDANPGPTRFGTLSIAGQTLTVTQAGSNYLAAQALTNVTPIVGHPYGAAVDGAGDVFFAVEKTIGEWTPAGNTVTWPFNTGTNYGWDMAVDGAGHLFIADDIGIAEGTTASANLTYLVTGLASPQGVAVDGADNVYFTDHVNGLVEEWAAATSNVTTLSSGLGNLTGVAVDVAGNVYATGYSAVISEWIAANGQTTPVLSTNLYTPEGLAVDGGGNLFIADTQNYVVKKWTVASQIVTTLPANGLLSPQCVAVDDAGDVYIADSSAGMMFELPHAFVATNSLTIPAGAANYALPVVLPATANLNPPFTPVSDQSWLTITMSALGMLSFSVPENTGALRTAHVTVLGQTIAITQQIIGPAPALNGVQMLGGGVIQFSFNGNPNASFSVLSTTNLTLPLSSWTVVGPALFAPAGQFQFTSPPTPSDTQVFYIVRSP